ncbi:MAG: MerR family transcriptional regulator [Bacteroidetes bacterium]|nr:MerR family transcriptional regulator [Bacteroidota bacterium]
MNKPKYAIQTAARLSGLTPFVLRAWEKRYDVVRPQRTPTNRRLYSDADVERLGMLRKLTEAGLAISSVARLPDGELRALLRKMDDAAVHGEADAKDYAGWRAALMRHVLQLDGAGLERALRKAERELSRHAFIDHVIGPFIADIGSGWREGRVRIVQEHLATTAVRTVLIDLLNTAPVPSDAERVISATPSGQMHELGVLLAALAASTTGRAVTHLGADLPAAEIALAARDLGAAEVLISIVYPPDDAETFAQLVELVRLLPAHTRIVAGGASAPAYLARIDHPSIMQLQSTSELWEHFASSPPRH